MRNQLLQYQARISVDRHIRLNNFAEFCRININMNLARSWAEFTHFPSNTIIPTGSDGHDHVTANNRLICVSGPMHTKHTNRQFMSLWEGTFPQ